MVALAASEIDGNDSDVDIVVNLVMPVISGRAGAQDGTGVGHQVVEMIYRTWERLIDARDEA